MGVMPSWFSTTTGYPAVVEVIAPDGQTLCTGTFISRSAILTASHCTRTKRALQHFLLIRDVLHGERR